MALPSFIFGQGTPYKTPEQLEQARRRVQSMMSGGPQDYSRPGGWLYAVRDAIGAAQERGRIKQGEQYADQQRQLGSNLFSQLMSGAGNAPAYPSNVAAGGSPTGAAATNTPVSVPSAPEIRQGLLARGLPEHVADAFLVNFKDESGLNPGINEKNPVVPGSRGGFGLAQWTGPRRRELEQFASQRGVDPSNTDAQLDFLMTELQGPEAKAAKSIFSAPDTASAAQAIVKNFLRPAPEHQQSRASRYARISDPAMDALVIDNPNAKPLSEAERNELRRRDEALFPFIMGRAGGNSGVQVASLDPSIGLPSSNSPAQTMPERLDPNGPPDPARAMQALPNSLNGGPVNTQQAMQPMANQAQAAPAVAPYDFTGNSQLSAGAGMQFQGGQPQQMAGGNLSPGQVTTGPDGRTYQNVEQIGGGYALSPVNLNSGPSAELLRQNDMAFGGALAPQGQAPQQVADASGYFPPAPSMDRAPVQPQAAPQNNNRLQILSEVLSNPFVPDEQKRVAQMMFQQEMEQRQQMSDPMRQLQMQKLQQDIARGGQTSDWSKLDDNRLYNQRTGEIRDLPTNPNAPSGDLGLNPQYGLDKDGNPVLLQLGKNGKVVQSQMPDGITLSKEPIKLDAGTHFVLLDPITRQPVGQIPKDVAGAASEGAEGKARGEASANLPVVEANANAILGMIDSLDTDPYLDSMVGPVAGRWLPNVSADAARVQSKMDQIGGQAFLQAFNSLKGGGQITEVEGQKATQAIARLNSAQSASDYRQALNELREIVMTGVQRARQQSGGRARQSAVPAAQQPQTPAPANNGGFRIIGVE